MYMEQTTTGMKALLVYIHMQSTLSSLCTTADLAINSSNMRSICRHACGCHCALCDGTVYALHPLWVTVNVQIWYMLLQLWRHNTPTRYRIPQSCKVSICRLYDMYGQCRKSNVKAASTRHTKQSISLSRPIGNNQQLDPAWFLWWPKLSGAQGQPTAGHHSRLDPLPQLSGFGDVPITSPIALAIFLLGKIPSVSMPWCMPVFLHVHRDLLNSAMLPRCMHDNVLCVCMIILLKAPYTLATWCMAPQPLGYDQDTTQADGLWQSTSATYLETLRPTDSLASCPS